MSRDAIRVIVSQGPDPEGSQRLLHFTRTTRNHAIYVVPGGFNKWYVSVEWYRKHGKPEWITLSVSAALPYTEDINDADLPEALGALSIPKSTLRELEGDGQMLVLTIRSAENEPEDAEP